MFKNRCRFTLSLIVGMFLLLLPFSINTFSKDKKKKAEPVVIVPTPLPTPIPVRPANGSLYTDESSMTSLVTDFKPHRVGDLVFVDVIEETDGKVESNAKRERDSGVLGGIGTLIGALPIPGASTAGTVVGALGTRKHDGKGSTERKSTVNARITARVIEVLPNGDLRIAAQKVVKINKENEHLILHGIIRQRDVSAQNIVPTTQIGDLYVELNGKGVASADNAPGWLFQFFEKIAPF
jgi:flagellar L-ring protein FlgH